MRNVQNLLIRENRQHFFGYKIQTTKLQKILVIRRDTCRMFRKKKRDLMKAKVKKLEENTKNKNIREMYKGINEFKKGSQPRGYVLKKHDGTIEADTTARVSQ